MAVFKKYLALPFIRQLYLGIIAVTLFSIALSGCLVGLFFWSSFKFQVKESQNLRIHSTTQDIDNWMNELLESLRYYAKLFNSTEMTYAEQVSMGDALLKKNWAIHSIALFATETSAVYALYQHPVREQKAAIDINAFKLAKNRKEEFISKAFIDGGQPMLAITMPVMDKNNNVTGVLKATINLRYMQHLFAVIPHEQYGYSYILDETNRILANNFDGSLLNRTIKPPYDYFYIMTHNIFKVYRGIDGKLVLGSKDTITTTHWYMVSEYPIALIFTKVRFNLLLMFIAFIGSLAVGFLGVRIVYKNIIHPLKDLTASAEKISLGDFNINIDTEAPHEFGQVSSAFNTMSNRLGELFTDLEYRLENERLISEIAFSFIHPDHIILRHNIRNNLQKIGKTTKADLIWIFYTDADGKVFNKRLQWLSSDDISALPAQCQTLVRDDYPWLFNALTNHKPFIMTHAMLNDTIGEHIDSADEIPQWAKTRVADSNEYKNCSLLNIKSQICLPFVDAGVVYGFVMLGFAAERVFSESDKNLYLTLTNVIGTGILKTRNGRLLMEEKERLAITLRSIGDAVISTNTEGMVLLMNPVAEHLTGWTSKAAFGLPLMQVLNLIYTDTSEPAKDPVAEALAKKCVCTYKSNLSMLSQSSVRYAIELSAAPIKTNENMVVGIVLVFRDITKILDTEREYFNIQKLEAVSYLSAGLAHDFNNLLFVIQGNITMALDDIPADSKLVKLLNRAQESTQKGTEITSQLLTFAKQGVLITGTTDIITRLDSIMDLLVSKGRAKVTYQIEKDLPLINMADGIVHQIITNLVINAMQAIKDKYGVLKISAELKQVTKADCLPLENRSYISMHIVDNGDGISPENLSKVFVPYFTTKETGTGLGLPTVFSLLTRYNGYIRINSTLGTGTDVEVFFPIIEQNSANPAPGTTVLNLMGREKAKNERLITRDG
jgi:PAS domain S-box-containing protein